MKFNSLEEAQETKEAIKQSIGSLPSSLWRSITWDNGLEGVCHLELSKEYNIPTYFCDPYSSWQKGGVENLNGLIRQYLPKGANLTKMTPALVYRIQESLNNRPRKKLGYLSPNEVIANLLTRD